MSFTTRRPAVEIAAEWIAAASLGAAVAFAVARLAPLGLVAAGGAGLALAVGALIGLRLIDDGVASGDGFAPGDWPAGDEMAPSDESAEPDELLLDDPLPKAEDSRVVRLFTADPRGGEGPGALPPPGEMLARIESFLGGPRAAAGAGAGAADTASPTRRDSAEASAALHAALADIRASLRRG